MKLRNKKTGEIKDFALVVAIGSIDDTTLSELNEEWEDYEDERQYTISDDGEVVPYAVDYINEGTDKGRKAIGNCFGTKEEAEKAVEKLKALKRLKDKGFKFNDYQYTHLSDYAQVNIKATVINDFVHDDLMLLFGGEG